MVAKEKEYGGLIFTVSKNDLYNKLRLPRLNLLRGEDFDNVFTIGKWSVEVFKKKHLKSFYRYIETLNFTLGE
jgi:nicotinamide mononucleotide adenylyltransferase